MSNSVEYYLSKGFDQKAAEYCARQYSFKLNWSLI